MKKLIIIVFLMSGIWSCQPIKAQTDTSKHIKITNCDSVVKHYSDSINVIWKMHHSEMKVQINKNLLGTVPLSDYISAFIFCLIGMFIRWVFVTRRAIKYNELTPSKFNLKYWILDNLKKISIILASMLLVFVFLRFSNELLGFAFSMLLALAIGFFFDFLMTKAMNINPTQIFKKELPNQKDTNA